MCLKDSISHSRWNRNCSDGMGNLYSGFVQLLLVNRSMLTGGSTVPGCGVEDAMLVV